MKKAWGICQPLPTQELAWSTLPNCIVTKSSLSTVTDTTSVFVRSTYGLLQIAPISFRAAWQLGTLAWAGQAHYRAPYLWARLHYLGILSGILWHSSVTETVYMAQAVQKREYQCDLLAIRCSDTPGLISWTWCLDLISQIISYPGSLWSIILCASYIVSPRKSLKMYFGRCLKAGQLTGQHERHHLRETVWEYRRIKSPEGVLCLR